MDENVTASPTDFHARFAFHCRCSNTYCSVNFARSIVLIGMMGAGKSSVGRCLERGTGLSRFDTDEIAAARLGLSIPEIFAKFGEEKFREIETQTLRELDPSKAMIIVAGGGIVLRD